MTYLPKTAQRPDEAKAKSGKSLFFRWLKPNGKDAITVAFKQLIMSDKTKDLATISTTSHRVESLLQLKNSSVFLLI